MDEARHIGYAISEEEMALAERSVEYAMRSGASAVQVTLDKGQSDTIALLDGDVDNIRHTGDRALTFRLFADGRYGVFATNKLDDKSVRELLVKAVESVRMLAPDPFRKLPDPSDTAGDAICGDELGLCWHGYDSFDADSKIAEAKSASVFGKPDGQGEGWKMVSEETEFCNSFADTLLLNSNGLRCRHMETSFEVSSQATVEDKDGNKYSGYQADCGTSPDKIGLGCGKKALEMAVMQIGPKKVRGGRHAAIFDNRVSGKLIKPIINALGGRAIQQKASFLNDTLGKKVFGEGLTLLDRPRERGRFGSILFEADGRACQDRDILEDGIVREYFIGTYMSGKLGMPATSETANRPVLPPFVAGDKGRTQGLRGGSAKLDRQGLMELCGEGLLITGFNGGNCHSATGDFSYGVEGFAFGGGKILHPIESMVITGNITELWNSFAAAGTDPVPWQAQQIPSLAFDGVNFSS